MVIYKTTNLVNGKFYIGQDMNNDPKYLGSGKRLIPGIKKYGVSAFKKEILEYCTDKAHMDEREQYWIHHLNAIEVGYNLTSGGTGGDTITNSPNRRLTIDKRRKSLLEHYDRMSKEEKKLKYGRPGQGSERQRNKMKDPINRKRCARYGTENSQFGSKWITNGLENKKIRNTDPLPYGWRFGRMQKELLVSKNWQSYQKRRSGFSRLKILDTDTSEHKIFTKIHEAKEYFAQVTGTKGSVIYKLVKQPPGIIKYKQFIIERINE